MDPTATKNQLIKLEINYLKKKTPSGYSNIFKTFKA